MATPLGLPVENRCKFNTSLRSKNKRSTFQRQGDRRKASRIDKRWGSTTLVNISQLSRPWRHLSQRKVWVGLSFLPLISISVSQAVPSALEVLDSSRSQRQLLPPLRRQSRKRPRSLKAAKKAPTPYNRSPTSKVPSGTCSKAAIARGSSPAAASALKARWRTTPRYRS